MTRLEKKSEARPDRQGICEIQWGWPGLFALYLDTITEFVPDGGGEPCGPVLMVFSTSSWGGITVY